MVTKKSQVNLYQKYYRYYRLRIKPIWEKANRTYHKTFKHLSIVLFPYKKYLITFLLLFVLLMILASSFEYKNRAENARNQLTAYPWLAISHLNMAQNWYEFGYLEKAKSTLRTINASFFLSWQIKTIPAWQKKYEVVKNNIETKEKIEAEIKQWEQWIVTNPPSFDIYLRLSLLNYQVKNDQQAKEYAQKAAYLNPTNENVKKMEELLNNLTY